MVKIETAAVVVMSETCAVVGIMSETASILVVNIQTCSCGEVRLLVFLW